MGYGRTSASNGKVFPWVFNFPATYWSQATALVQYIADQEGGLDALKGKKIYLVYHNSAYGKEPLRTLEAMAEKFGYRVPWTAGGSSWTGAESYLAADPERKAGLGADVGLGCDEPGRHQGSRFHPLSDGSLHWGLVVRL